jgi:hypothetical protein
MTRSVYEIFGVRWLKDTSGKSAAAAKIFAFAFPALLIGLLNTPAVQASLIGVLVVADLSRESMAVSWEALGFMECRPPFSAPI